MSLAKYLGVTYNDVWVLLYIFTNYKKTSLQIPKLSQSLKSFEGFMISAKHDEKFVIFLFTFP